ncbi:L,D-transpeptidase family protein [Pseudomethylobacillus aquaticus]|nr:L,D-transpeptidase family protein [Pseudomethylobacillus aquaticus]
MMHRLRLTLTLMLVAAAALPWNATAVDGRPFSSFASFNKFSPNYTENLLVRSLFDIGQGKLQPALNTINELLKLAPNFQLAHLVRGDLLMAYAKQPQAFASGVSSPERTKDFREEARVRIERYLDERPQRIPEPLWQLHDSQKYAIVIDTNRSRLFLYSNERGKLRYLADFYVTVGKNGAEKQTEGDKRTPVGVYYASSKLIQKLPDFYGYGAYPLNYPNEWDVRQGKNGSGIWLHGTPSNTYSRPPRASDGCVVMTNPDLKAIAPALSSGNTPVIITDNLTWQGDSDNAELQREALMQTLETWRKDWQSQDTDRYLSHYASEFFSSGNTDLNAWKAHKQRIQSRSDNVQVKLGNVDMYRYPSKSKAMAIVSFDQDYKSNLLSNKMRKRQYWVLENKRWKILYEGPA